jgi:O-antigen/teichoic acid export membrane protein
MIADIRTHKHYAKATYWAKAISITGAAQIIVQAVGFISGILVIRLLPVQEYALYTLANTMLGTMTVLADGGISTGVMAQGGKVWQDREKLGAVLATGLDLRRKFAIGSLIVSTPILLYLLLHNGASWLTTVLIVLSLIPAFYAALSDSLLEIVPKLQQSILPLQKNQVTVGVGRLLLSALTLFIFPWTFVAILASGFPRIYGNIQLRKIANDFVDKKQLPDPIVRKEILAMVKRILPGAIYYSLSGQITIWLISIFGNTTSVAQLGALGRLAMLLTLFSVLISTLVIPRFARLPEIKTILLKRFMQIFAFLLFVMISIVGVVYIFPNQILWILGNEYAGLQFELFLSIIGSGLGMIAGVAFSLYTSRGWVIHPAILILVNVGSIIGFLFFVDVRSLDKG